MISCDKEELDSENATKFEETEEIQSQNYYQNCNEKEETLVNALIDISEKHCEEDTFMACSITTGWDEAVKGWGHVTPLACLQPQKKSKKPKSSEDSSSCLLCSEMLKVMDKTLTTETKTSSDQLVPDCKLEAVCVVSQQENVQSPAEGMSGINCSASSNCTPFEVSNKDAYCDKLHTTQKYQGEPQQTKELPAWYQEKSKSQEAVMFREVQDFNLDPAMPNYDCGSKQSLNTYLVLPPVRAAILNDRSVSASRKSKGVSIQQQLKAPSHPLIEHGLYGNATKKMEQKDERGVIEKIPDLAHEQIRMPEAARLFGSIMPRGPLLQETERLYWQCSFIPGKNSATINAISSTQNSHLTNIGLLQARVVQNKGHLRPDGLRPPFAQHFRNPNEAKQRNRAKVEAASLLSGPILPSLTVTRVEIPVSSYRLM